MALCLHTVTVCGGGNAAHVIIPLLVKNGCRVILYTPFADEAARFREGGRRGKLQACFQDGVTLTGSPCLVTTDAAEAAQSEMILLAVPAFAHGPLLAQLSPFMRPGIVIGALPARGGFDLQALYYLHHHGLDGTVFCGHTLPWACRIEEYGRQVKVLGVKETVGLATAPADQATAIAAFLSRTLEVPFHPMANTLAVSLGNIGQVVHPGIMYGLLKNYDGHIWQKEEIPLFYQGVNAETARLLEDLSGEITATAARLQHEYGVNLGKVPAVGQWLLYTYARYIADDTSLERAFRTNRAYCGLKVPVVRAAEGEGYRPDFNCRYLTEDVPFGLLFSRAVALMVGCPTPRVDEVIRATGEWMGKRYFDANGAFAGPDLAEARLPAHYGIYDAAHLVSVTMRGLLEAMKKPTFN